MDIAAYLNRIQYDGRRDPTLQTLQALHQAHIRAVPFENLDIQRGYPIRLENTALFQKIVIHRRGGLCYELNGLFFLLLRALGFHVTLLSASMAHTSGEFGPEIDHPTLLVQLAEDCLADVGNGDSFLRPLKIQHGWEYSEGEYAYRMERDGEGWIVQRCGHSGLWHPEYRFSLQPHELADFTDRCYYYQHAPESPFTRSRVCSRATSEGRITVRDQWLITTIHGKKDECLLPDEEYETVLAQAFGIVFTNIDL